jgi:hypothetical protein
MNDEDNEMIPCLNGNIVVGFDNFIMLISENARLKFAKREIETLLENLCLAHGIMDGNAFSFQHSLNAIDRELRRLNEIIRLGNKQ